MKHKRLIFMGTPGFAAKVLGRLIEKGHDIAAIYTQPPKPANRGMSLRKSAVQALAEHHNLPVFTPTNLRDAETQGVFAAHHADIAIVVAYGLLLPKAILAAPKYGCLNVHASLLPRWRGAAPIQRALLAGDKETGISIMQMEEGLDTGPVLSRRVLPIAQDMDALMLHDRLAEIGAELLLETMGRLDDFAPQEQDHTKAIYAAKLTRGEGKLDFNKNADELDRQIRAFHPWPGAFATLPGGDLLKIHRASAVERSEEAAPGTVLVDGFTIACAKGALRLLGVQRAGKKPMQADDFLRGSALKPGDRLH